MRRDVVGLPAVAGSVGSQPAPAILACVAATRRATARSTRSAGTRLRPLWQRHGRGPPIASRATAGRLRQAPRAAGRRAPGPAPAPRREPPGEPSFPPTGLASAKATDGGDRVDGDAPAQRTLGGRQQEQGRQGEQGHADEGREDERLMTRRSERQATVPRASRPPGPRRVRPPRRSPASITATPASARKTPATGLPQTVSTESTAASTGRRLCRASSAPEADRDPQGEREATGEQERRGTCPEPEVREACALAVSMTGEGAEQAGSRHGGESADQSRPERRPERREEDAVAGQVVPPVPVVVPEQEAVGGEQVGAKRLRSEIGAGGLQEQIGDREDGGRRA